MSTCERKGKVIFLKQVKGLDLSTKIQVESLSLIDSNQRKIVPGAALQLIATEEECSILKGLLIPEDQMAHANLGSLARVQGSIIPLTHRNLLLEA